MTTDIHIIEKLQKFSIMECLTKDEFEFIAGKVKLKTATKHDYLYKTGEVSSEIFFVLEGVVKIVALSQDKREVIKMMHHAGSILIEQSLTGEDIRRNGAVVMSSKVVYLTLESSYVIDLIKSNYKFSLCLIIFLGRKLYYSEQRLESLALSDARTRILDFLKSNVEKYGIKVGSEVLLKHDFTQQDIADFTGTSRQTVTTVLNDLKKSNKILSKRSSILIRDIACLN